MIDCMEGHSTKLAELVAQYGSPVHLHLPERMTSNVTSLQLVAATHEVALETYFARKANKCLCYVDSASELGVGFDTASVNELEQCLQRRIPGSQLVYTAAIKEPRAIDRAIANGVTIVIDNSDEWDLVRSRLHGIAKPAELAIRLRGFHFKNHVHRSRFGFDIGQVSEFLLNSIRNDDVASRVHWRGLHFHLDGGDAEERISAIHQCLDLIEALRENGMAIEFIDMGGGFPVCYLESEAEWQAFWQRIDAQSTDRMLPRITPVGHDFHRVVRNGRVESDCHCYPYWQSRGAPDWLDQILAGTDGRSQTVAKRLRECRMTLRCEPGRALVDGCGMTVAQVCFRKRDCDGNLLVGLAMNRTHCQTTSVDFAVDPRLVWGGGQQCEPAEGFLVGAYCMESEYITPRKLRFPAGVAVGDLVVFPNTAGYQMHFMESRSHQFELPKNLVLRGNAVRLDGEHGDSPQLDAIDGGPSMEHSSARQSTRLAES